MIDSLEKFKKIAGYDIQKFFESFVLFCNSYYPLIVSYYSGVEDIDVEDSFDRLDDLSKEVKNIEPLFVLKSSSLTGIDMWEILEYFSDCQSKLWTIENTSKWLRSAVIGRHGLNVTMKRLLRTRETFENVSNDLGLSRPQDDWVNIAVNNLIEEESYGAEEVGVMFKINLRRNGNHNIQNIVDNLNGESILGKDIDKNFRFEDNDLVVVEYKKAVHQALDTMLSCMKGAIPEFSDYGISNDLIGSSVNAIQYPSLFKHIVNMFQRDARWKNVSLLDIYHKEDKIFMKIQATTITNDFLETNIQI